MIVGMKRLILIVTVCMISLAALAPLAPVRQPLSSYAESEVYAVAETADVWFYGSENESDKLFCIPRTYYVKIVSRGERFSLCEYLKDISPYKKVLGYCLTDSLTFVDFTPQRPYLFREVTVEYVLPGAALGAGKFSGLKETFVYYGTRYENGQLYFYVGKNGEFDYIPASEELIFDLNTDYLPEPESKPTAVGTKKGDGLSAVQIVLITLSAVAVLVVAIFVARGKKAAPPENFEP